MRAAAIALLGIMATTLGTGPSARADEGDPPTALEDDAAVPIDPGRSVHHVEPPPPPDRQPRELLLDIRGAAVVPVLVQGLCPGGHECVMNAGIGIGVTVEQRWPDRVGLLLSYDAWVVDADSLFEIGLMHSFRIGLRYVIDASLNVHPFLEASVAFLAFGDTAQVSAVGGAVTAGGGAEVEISDSIAVLVDAELWTFATGSFETRDAVRRSDGFGANLAVQISVGLEVLLGTI